jgi:hypothetical protein
MNEATLKTPKGGSSMQPKAQVVTHEAALRTLRGGHDPREMGARGAAKREANWATRIGLHREELEKLATPAIKALGDVLAGKTKPTVSSTAFGILDRIGMGPTAKQEVTIPFGDTLEGRLLKLDERRRSDERGNPRNRPDS